MRRTPHVRDRHHRREHRVVLIVVLVHPVAAHGVEIRDLVDVAAQHGQVARVRRIVDRVRLGHPDHAAVPYPGGIDETELAQFLRGEGDQVRVGARPEPVAFETEVLEPEARRPRFGHHGTAPVVEVLDTADLHARRVDVDPVVREDVVGVDHQRDGQEVAVVQPIPGRPDRGRRRRIERLRQVPQRHRGDEMIRFDPARPVGRPDARSDDPSGTVLEARHLVTQVHLAAEASDLFRRRLPHLAGAETWILEPVDEGLDGLRALLELRGVQDRLGQAEPLDPLRGPFGANLGARDAPHLFRVRLEEDLEEPLPEPVRDPLLEVFLDGIRLEVPADVAGYAQERIPEAEAQQGVLGLQRIVEILPAVVNA